VNGLPPGNQKKFTKLSGRSSIQGEGLELQGGREEGRREVGG
jgi:hypothetical protein